MTIEVGEAYLAESFAVTGALGLDVAFHRRGRCGAVTSEHDGIVTVVVVFERTVGVVVYMLELAVQSHLKSCTAQVGGVGGESGVNIDASFGMEGVDDAGVAEAAAT